MHRIITLLKLLPVALSGLLIFAGCSDNCFSPAAITADPAGKIIYVAGENSNELVAINLKTNKIINRLKNLRSPSGIAMVPDGSRLFVTCGGQEGSVAVIDPATGKREADLPAGDTPLSPVVSPDGRFLFFCNRFENDVWIIDISDHSVVAKVPVLREPVAMTIDKTGSLLFVANHLPAGPANSGDVGASVSVIDLQNGKVTKNIRLPDGSSALRGICISPDNRYVLVTHILAHYQLPTTQLERGWMNTNALSIIDASTRTLYATVLLDDVDRGAANPWSVNYSPDGRYIAVTHAGTHEVSLIDAPGLFEKLQLRMNSPSKPGEDSAAGMSEAAGSDIPLDLTFLVDIRRRIPLAGKGPRNAVIIDNQLFIANYYSDCVTNVTIDKTDSQVANEILKLSHAAPDKVRTGEMLFNDASLCFQNWQSCASCHPDTRADGLNWDLLNDGVGNPKNTKSLLLSIQTPPAMISGIRDRAETAVRSGLKFIEFSVHPEGYAAEIDAFLKKMKPVPSPLHNTGKLSPAAMRGKDIYRQAGCASCHPEPLFTDLKKHDVGTGTGSELKKEFDTPALVEVWRTAPYLYDGRASSMQEVLTRFNIGDRHGRVSDLNEHQLQDLIDYVMSL